MKREQVVEVFKSISSLYPFFEVSTEKVNAWHRIMRKMDYERVMTRLEQHAQESKYAPTIAEITAYAPKENEHLEKIESWKDEAEKVSDETKQEFAKELKNLIKAKAK